MAETTESRQSPGPLGEPKGLSPASPQGTWGPTGTSPTSPQGTLGEDWAWTGLVLYVHCAYQHTWYDILCVYIPWRPSTGRLVRAKRAKSGLVLAFICLYSFSKKKQRECLEYDVCVD